MDAPSVPAVRSFDYAPPLFHASPQIAAMKNHSLVPAHLLAALLLLCAPLSHAQVRVTAIDEALSTMTETPAGDTLLEGSHVIVAPAGGQGKLFGTIGMVGGALGALLGTAIDSAQAQSAAKESTRTVGDALKLKWFNEMNAALNKLASDAPEKYKITVGTPEEPGAKLRVFARLAPQKTEGQFSASIGVKTRFNGPDEKEIRRDYAYPLFPNRALVGEGSLTSAGPTSLRESSATAINRLAPLIARDVSGALQSVITAETLPPITLRLPNTEQPTKYFLVEETDDVYVVVPNFRDRPARFYWIMLDKAQVKKEG